MRYLFLKLLVLAFILPACGQTIPPSRTEALTPTSAPQSRELYVFAAASLTEPLNELILAFEQSHPGVRVIPNYAGSQQLAQQIAQGAPADVFASANQVQMEAAIESGRIQASEKRVLVNNRLVVILPSDNPGEIEALQDLARPGHSLILAAEAVPVGWYSLIFLEQASQNPEFGADYKDAALKNVVSYEENVKAVLSKIILGEADAGIVYSSDVSPSDTTKLVKLDIPDSLNVMAAYYVAPLSDSPVPDLARAFIDSLLAPAGQEVLSRFGFLPQQ